jgi:murein L,D-transpeptidase YcbB/YkuD
MLIAVVAALGLYAQQPPAAPLETLRTRVEQVHDAPHTRIRGERLLKPDQVFHFFEKRSFAAPWRLPDGAESVRRAIAAIDADGLTPAHYHLAAIDGLIAARVGAPGDRALDDDLQILLTDAVGALIDHVRYGKVMPSSLDRRWNVDPRAAAPPLHELIEQVANAPAADAAIEALKPSHFIYTGLKGTLARMRSRADAGGWPAIAAGPTLKPGMSDPRVEALRKRLAATGELASEGAASGPLYDEALLAAVRAFQDNHRLSADGVVGPSTLQALNVSAETRVQQIRANLERVRWVIGGLDDSFVLVNLPAFKAYLIRDRKNVWETRTMIGREARQTPTFRADMRYIVLNPDWTVPPTILAQDVLAGMRKGENTVAKKGLTILDRQGRRVDPATIDWTSARPGNFPYTLRQPPGDNNALGRVKFIFPNEHSIFLHDTPSRELFAADQRTFSSGCIRVEQPLDLAALLLGDQGWTPERIESVIGSRKSETVFLKEPLPVLIVYWTVSVGVSGQPRYAKDVYNRDGAIIKALTVP